MTTMTTKKMLKALRLTGKLSELTRQSLDRIREPCSSRFSCRRCRRRCTTCRRRQRSPRWKAWTASGINGANFSSSVEWPSTCWSSLSRQPVAKNLVQHLELLARRRFPTKVWLLHRTLTIGDVSLYSWSRNKLDWKLPNNKNVFLFVYTVASTSKPVKQETRQWNFPLWWVCSLPFQLN